MKTTDLRFDYRALIGICKHFEIELEEIESILKFYNTHIIAYFGYISHCHFKKISIDESYDINFFMDWISLEDGRMVKILEMYGKDMSRIMGIEDEPKKKPGAKK